LEFYNRFNYVPKKNLLLGTKILKSLTTSIVLSIILVMIISPSNFGIISIAGADLSQGLGKDGSSSNQTSFPGKGVIQTISITGSSSENTASVVNTVTVSQISSSLQSLSSSQVNNGNPRVIPFHSGPQDISPQSTIKKSIDVISLSSRPSAATLVANQISGFEGSDYPASCYCTPPDGSVAVSNNYIFEEVNSEGKIWSKSGALLSTVPMATFFNTGTLFISDPRVVYDNQSGHWFSSILANDNIHPGFVKVAVSKTSDPTGAWWIYALATHNLLPDQPRLAVSDDKVTVVASDFTSDTGFWTGDQIIVLNKSQMITGSNSTFANFGPDNTRFHVEPAVYPVAGQADQWLVQDGYSGATAAEYLKISGLPGVSSVTYASMFTTAISLTSIPPGGAQPGTTTLVATNDARILSASMRGGIITWTANDGCGSNSCIRWDVASTGGILLQDKEVSITGKSLYFAAVSQNAPNSFGVIYDFSSATDYPSIGFTGKSAVEPYGTVDAPVLVKAGTGPDISGRHGDYHAVRADPFTSNYYGMGEYNTQTPYWNTFVSVNSITQNPQVQVSPSSGPVGSIVTVNGTGYAANSAIAIKYDGAIQSIPPTNSNGTGSFSVKFTVPKSTFGTHQVNATDSSAHSAAATFNVTPKIILAPSSGPVGSMVTISGTGFAANSAITVLYGGVTQTIPTTNTNATGSFSVKFTVPISTFGLHPVRSSDAAAHAATVNFRVIPKITLTPSSGLAGTIVTVNGTGYAANSAMTIKFDGVVQTIPATTTSTLGSFSTTFTVPVSPVGLHTVAAADASAHTANAKFNRT